MNFQSLLLTASLISFLVLSCANDVSISESKQVVIEQDHPLVAKDINVEEFRSLISDKSIVLDVRRKVEYDAGHLKGAVNIDWFDEQFLEKVNKLDKSKKLLIHCASGGRSSSAMNKLKGQGFPELYNMLGGFNAWKIAGYDFEK